MMWLLKVVTGVWLLQLAWRFKRALAAAALVVFVFAAYGWAGLLVLVVCPPLLALAWRWVHPWSYWRFVGWLVARHRLRTVYGLRWVEVMQSCGLHRPLPGRPGEFATPRLVQVTESPVGDVLHVRLLTGQEPGDFECQAAELAHALNAPAVRVTSTGPGLVDLTLVERDVLADGVVLDDVDPVTDLRAVRFAVGEDGAWRTRDYANIAAEVGGGVPGSGKTAGETSLACGLIQNPAVQYVVIDGKGGEDWSWNTPRAAAYTNEDEDLNVVLDLVESVHQLMRARLKTQKTQRGQANFWNLPLDPAHPVVFLVVDEVQTFTDAKGMDKDTKTVAATITARLSALVKKGRSAGIITRLLTQKPTSDAIPTAIRDNASVRTAWRVLSDDAAEAILGPVVRGSAVSPVDIPAGMPGVAVVADAGGQLERVRFPYIDEHTAEQIATRTADLRRDLTDLTSPTPADKAPADEEASA
ncbi:hypothetical protein [Jiangella alba]|uniref:FtsK domain-containing protein n=1 Tax=Jiangella alba TaxID=561176 RepID=A0A1H5PMN9_9ACTN|nr:hypothetical protein [Jiangella alba]SEF14381.1 hypothetical protein SAMN04488561_4623 [Jiangella alba]